MRLEELLNVKQDSPLYNEGDRRSTFYAQSWALTHLIVLGQPSRRDKLALYLDRLSSGVPEMEAWKQAFGADQMDRELNAYTGRQVFNAYRFRFTDKLERMPRHTAETFCQVPSKYNSLLCESFNGLDLADLGPIR